MARSRATDLLQQHRFWLFEVPSVAGAAIPALSAEAGFSSCSAIEVTVTNREYRQINEMTPRYFPESASVAAVTLRRGAAPGNGDFYRWINGHQYGLWDTRRDFVLVQFSGLASEPLREGAVERWSERQDAVSAALIGGRAWILRDCVPTRYSTGEFDATSGQVSIDEIEIQPRKVIQVDARIPEQRRIAIGGGRIA